MKSCDNASAVGAIELKQRLAKATDFFGNHVEEINSLNVFPVPDGDTGINMHHTLRRAYAEIAALETASVSEIMLGFARGSLMGARGNSGTIMSQLFRGFRSGSKRCRFAHGRELGRSLRARCRACLCGSYATG